MRLDSVSFFFSTAGLTKSLAFSNLSGGLEKASSFQYSLQAEYLFAEYGIISRLVVERNERFDDDFILKLHKRTVEVPTLSAFRRPTVFETVPIAR